MDATPVTLGQEFGGCGLPRCERGSGAGEGPAGVGGTGAGRDCRGDRINALGVRRGGHRTDGRANRESPSPRPHDHFEAQGSKDAVVMASGALKTIAVSLFKIANDIRFLGSGPHLGHRRDRIPALQPGHRSCRAR